MEDQIIDNVNRRGPVQAPYFRQALQYGFILGAASVVLQLGAYLMGIDAQNPNTETMPKVVMGLAGIILSVIIYRMVMVNHRDQLQNGYLSLTQCMGIGAVIGLGSGLVVGIYMLLFGTVINPGYAEEMRANMYAAWEKQGMDEEMMDKAWGFTKYMVSPITGALTQILGGPIGGLIFGLIIGLFVKNDRLSN